MRVFPANGDDWTDVALVPFKTYPVVMFLVAIVWTRELSGDPIILYILLGYLGSLLMITWISVADAVSGRPAATNWRWSAAIMVLGLIFALKWLPTLAE